MAAFGRAVGLAFKRAPKGLTVVWRSGFAGGIIPPATATSTVVADFVAHASMGTVTYTEAADPANLFTVTGATLVLSAAITARQTASFAVTGTGTLKTKTLASAAYGAGSPVIAQAPVILGTPRVGQTLSATTGSWTAFPAPTGYAYVWKADGSAISGATAASYVLTSAEAGKVITVEVTATNSVGASAAAPSSATSAVTSAPAIASVTLSSSSPTVGDELSVTISASGYPTPTPTYVWRADGTIVGTGATYTVQAGDIGKTITCTVTETNTVSAASLTATATAPVPASINWYDASAYDLMTAGADFNNDRYFLPAAGSDLTVGANSYSLTKVGGKYPKQSATFAEWFAFTASSTAARTYTDNTGVLKSDLAANAPRFTYANGKRQFRLEDQCTNLVTYSGAMDNAAWNIWNSGRTANAAVAPDGTTTATLVYPIGTAAVPGLYSSAVTVQTMSVFAKAAGKSWLCLLDVNATGGAAWFDLTNGVIGTVITGYTATMTAVGNGWYRCSVTKTSGAIGWFPEFGVADADASNTGTASGTNGIYVWGFQAENAAFASDYIPTTSSAVTRAIETARFSPLMEAILQRSAASVVVRGQTYAQDNGRIIGGDTTDALLMRASNTAVRANKTSNLDATLGGGGTLTAANGVALGFDGSGRSLTGNGGTIATDANGPGGRTTVYLGRDATNGAGTYGFGYYDFVGISPERLTNTQLQTLAVAA